MEQMINEGPYLMLEILSKLIISHFRLILLYGLRKVHKECKQLSARLTTYSKLYVSRQVSEHLGETRFIPEGLTTFYKQDKGCS